MKASAPAGAHPVAVLPQQRPDHRDVAGPGAHQRVADGEAAAHMPLGVGQAMRGAVGAQAAASARARASRRSVFTLRLRWAYMGAKFGSATMTSWPSASRHRATHSLSVDDSITICARGRAPEHVGEPFRLRPDRGARSVPPLGQDADLAVLLVDVDANMVHGWPPTPAALTACLCGATLRHHVQ